MPRGTAINISMGINRLRRASGGGGGGFDYIITNNAMWGTIPSGLQTGGGRIGVAPGSYPTQTISFAPSAPLVFRGINPATTLVGDLWRRDGAPGAKARIDKLRLDGCNNIVLEDLHLVSTDFNETPLPAVEQAGIIGSVSVRRCWLQGNVEGSVAAIDATAELPYYACIIPQFNASGVVTSLIVTKANVGNLTPDGLTNGTYSMTFSAGASSNGITFSVAPVATFTVVDGVITSTNLVSGGASSVTSTAINNSTGILSKIIVWTGQKRMATHLPYGIEAPNGATRMNGTFILEDNVFTDLSNCMKGIAGQAGTVIQRNTFDRFYQDAISIGASSTRPGKPLDVLFNFFRRPFPVIGDAGDPHGDAPVQLFISGDNANWKGIRCIGNVMVNGATRVGAGTQAFFFGYTSGTGIYENTEIIGNIAASAVLTNGIAVAGTKNVLIARNAIVRYDPLDAANLNALNAVVPSESRGGQGQSYIADNIIEGILLSNAANVTSPGSVVLGNKGATIAYASVFANHTSASRDALSGAISAYTSQAAYSTKGVGTDGLVNFANQTVDRTKLRTNLRFITQSNVTASSAVLTPWTKVMGGGAGQAISITDGRYQIADDESGTNATALTASPSTVDDGKFVRVEQVSAASDASAKTTNLTVAGNVFAFSTITVDTATYTAADNQATAYSTISRTGVSAPAQRITIVWRSKCDTLVSGARQWAQGTIWGMDYTSTSQARITAIAAAQASFRHTTSVDTNTHTYALNLDLNAADIDSGMPFWIDGTLVTGRTNTTWNITTNPVNMGTANTTNLFGNATPMGIFGTGAGANLFDGRFEFFWVDWGDNTYPLPDFSDPNIWARLSPTILGANGSGLTGSQPRRFYKGSVADWNAGIANLGSDASVPMNKAAGTYV